MPRQTSDLSKTEFRDALRRNGFDYLSHHDRFIDLRHLHARRHIVPLKDDRGRILRQASLDALIAARAAYEAELAEQAAAELAKITLAGKLAPQVMPPCRADLAGATAVAQLADDFILLTTTAEGVLWTTLIRLGWQAEQLKRHADAARIVAQRKQSRQATEELAA